MRAPAGAGRCAEEALKSFRAAVRWTALKSVARAALPPTPAVVTDPSLPTAAAAAVAAFLLPRRRHSDFRIGP